MTARISKNLNKNQISRDIDIALNLERQINPFGVTENAFPYESQFGSDYKPRTLIDQTLELIDPTPNIHTLFVQFNERYFGNVLLPVEVKWSQRMTSCAGTCTFHPKNKQCVIALSAPLLQLRPRKDLVETLLHEMIHGYLFLTNNNRDRDGHGPEFCKHMNRINQTAGTKITITHSFHEEVRLHQQHWWRCNGVCQRQPPYFGMVRRATNRAPGASDFWWQRHQQTCGGQFIKIKEPENYKSKNVKAKSKPAKSTSTGSTLETWLQKPTAPNGTLTTVHSPITTKKMPNSSNPFKGSSSSIRKPIPTQIVGNTNNLYKGLKKLGNSTNNVHGWGTGGPGSSTNNSQPPSNPITTTTPFSCGGPLGGSNSGRSNLLDKFGTVTRIDKVHKINASNKVVRKTTNLPDSNIAMVGCPICNNFVCAETINSHIDSCLKNQNRQNAASPFLPTSKKVEIGGRHVKNESKPSEHNDLSKKRKNDEIIPVEKYAKLDFTEKQVQAMCPVCNKQFPSAEINAHLDTCLLHTREDDFCSPAKLINKKDNHNANNSIISLSDSSEHELSSPDLIISINFHSTPNSKSPKGSHKCLVCDKFIPPKISLNDHLEDCIGMVFNDESILSEGDSKDIVEVPTTESGRYPCPVCMELIGELDMNQHLDSCLKN